MKSYKVLKIPVNMVKVKGDIRNSLKQQGNNAIFGEDKSVQQMIKIHT